MLSIPAVPVTNIVVDWLERLGAFQTAFQILLHVSHCVRRLSLNAAEAPLPQVNAVTRAKRVRNHAIDNLCCYRCGKTNEGVTGRIFPEQKNSIAIQYRNQSRE
jgi:hypothetical protein